MECRERGRRGSLTSPDQFCNVGVACYAAGGDLLDGGVHGVEEGFGFGGAGHGGMGDAGFEVGCGYGVIVLGGWYGR